MNGMQRPQTAFWRSLSLLDWIALVLAAMLLITSWSSKTFRIVPGLGFLRFLGLLAIFYLFYRFWSHWKEIRSCSTWSRSCWYSCLHWALSCESVTFGWPLAGFGVVLRLLATPSA